MNKKLLITILAVVLIIIIPGATLADSYSDSEKVVIVGAAWDMPIGLSPTVPIVDTSNTLKNQEVISMAAQYLSKGKNLIVAGGSGGTVNEEMYQTIIEEAAKINPEHGGSIVRIGGLNKDETRRFMDSYLASLRIF